MGGKERIVKIDEKREVIEVLLCAAGSSFAVCEVARQFLDFASHLDQACTDLWFEVFAEDKAPRMNHPRSHDLAAIEAAYRLIKSSATLRKEWFGR